MPDHTSLGTDISVAAIRDYLFAKNVQKGDTIVLNPVDFDKITDEYKSNGETIEIPFSILGVRIVKDTADEVPAGKLHILKNDSTIQ